MAQHVLFDLEAAERSMRAQIAEMNAAAHPDGMTDHDRAFVDLQIGLQDAVVAVAMWHLKAKNSGADMASCAEALGHAVGSMTFGFIANSPADPDALTDLLFSAIDQTISNYAAVNDGGEAEEDVIVLRSSISAMNGGRA